MATLRLTYSIALKKLKLAVLRNMGKYLIPYLANEITKNQFDSDWDTYVRPMLFDILPANFHDLGMQAVGDTSQCIQGREYNRSCRWDVPCIANGYCADLSALNVPYSGPYDAVSSLASGVQDFASLPWVEDDDVGPYIPPWTDESGIYHPGYYAGNFSVDTTTNPGHRLPVPVGDPESFQSVQAGTFLTAKILYMGSCSRLYADFEPGHFGDFVHEFEFFHDRLDDWFGITTTPVWVLSNTIDNVHSSPGEDAFGLWLVQPWPPTGTPQTTDAAYLFCNGPGDSLSEHCIGHNITLNDLRGSSFSNLNDGIYVYDRNPVNKVNLFDMRESNPYYNQPNRIGYYERNFKVTIEKRGKDVIFIIWMRRYYDTEDQFADIKPLPSSWLCSFCDEFEADTRLPQWPGASQANSKSVSYYDGSSYHHYGISIRPPDPSYRGQNFWWPVDLVWVESETPDYPDLPDKQYLIIGHNGVCGTPQTVYTMGDTYYVGNAILYDDKPTDVTTLFIDGGAWQNSYMEFVAYSSVSETDALSLTLYNRQGYGSGDMSLFVFSTANSGVVDSKTLYLQQNTVINSAPLTISGIPRPYTNEANLFVYDGTGLQDFTTYTINDPSGYYTDKWTYNRLYPELINDADTRFYKDFGEGMFSKTFNFDFDFQVHQINDGRVGLINMSNTLSAASGWWTYQDEALTFEVLSSGDLYVLLRNNEDQEVTDLYPIQRNTVYHCNLERRHSATGYYVDVTGGTQSKDAVFSLSIPVADDTEYRYLIVGNSPDDENSDSIEFVLENIDFGTFFNQDFMTLFIRGIETANLGRTLHTIGWAETDNIYTTLHTFGGTEGWSWDVDDISLYINDGGYIGSDGEFSRTLFIYNTQTHLDMNDSATLYIDGWYEQSKNSIPLVVFMLTENNYMPMYIKGPDGQQNWFLDQDTLPVYLNRPDQSQSMGLYLHNEWLTTNSYMTLHTDAVLGVPSDNIALAFPNIVWGRPNTYTELFIQGAVPESGVLDLVMPDTHADLGQGMSLVCYHGGGEPNTYISCYMFGAYLDNNNVTLAMPETHGVPDGEVPTYIRGY